MHECILFLFISDSSLGRVIILIIVRGFRESPVQMDNCLSMILFCENDFFIRIMVQPHFSYISHIAF